ncbi:MAG: hypothetical protein HZA53_16860 [Planctomycetes bacterium]|nr:hypothetical protein [Planctomycetota bacterium]
MSEGAEVPLDGQVYVRSEVLYVDRQRVHLADNREYEVAPGDAGLLELVHRGDSDFALLCRRVSELSSGVSADQVAAQLAAVLRDPRSILDLRPSLAIEPPDVIVCNFSGREGVASAGKLVERLRRSRRVLHLGLDRRVRGDWPWNASMEKARGAGVHESWHDFAQWCRGVIARHTGALLVLCGPQDAILFGDLASRLRTVALLDPAWPTVVGPGDVVGSDWIPEDPYPLVRDVFYALRFSTLDELEAVSRTTSTSFARLEGYALRHAVAVGYSMTDQPAALTALGRDGLGDELVHATPVRALRTLRPSGERVLLLVAGVEHGIEPLTPMLHLVRPAVEARRVHQVVLVTQDAWFDVRFDKQTVHALDGGRARPHPSHCVGAVVLPGLLRDCRPALDVMARGIPVGLVPSRQPHPLQELLPKAAVLSGITASGLDTWLGRLGTAEDPLARELVTAQQRALRPRDVFRFVERHIQERIAGAAGGSKR